MKQFIKEASLFSCLLIEVFMLPIAFYIFLYFAMLGKMP